LFQYAIYVNEIHYGHPGVENTLPRAREYMFWPNMNQQIKEKALNCETCLKYRSKQPHIMEMQSHQIPSSQYERVGLDLLELPMEGKKVIALVTTDHYSDFIEVDFLKSTTTDIMVKCCKRNFAGHSIPKVVVTDNEPQFISAEFGNFASKWEFSHTTSSPYHQQTFTWKK
jgi:hypothetical protein